MECTLETSRKGLSIKNNFSIPFSPRILVNLLAGQADSKMFIVTFLGEDHAESPRKMSFSFSLSKATYFKDWNLKHCTIPDCQTNY